MVTHANVFCRSVCLYVCLPAHVRHNYGLMFILGRYINNSLLRVTCSTHLFIIHKHEILSLHVFIRPHPHSVMFTTPSLLPAHMTYGFIYNFCCSTSTLQEKHPNDSLCPTIMCYLLAHSFIMHKHDCACAYTATGVMFIHFLPFLRSLRCTGYDRCAVSR